MLLDIEQIPGDTHVSRSCHTKMTDGFINICGRHVKWFGHVPCLKNHKSTSCVFIAKLEVNCAIGSVTLCRLYHSDNYYDQFVNM